MSIEEVSATFEKSYEAGVIPRTQHDSHDPEKNAGEVAGSRSSSTCTGTAQQDESDPEAQEPPSTREEEQTPLPVIVPRSERRGLLAGLTIIPEVEEPKHYPRRRRWFLTFVVAVAAIAAPLGSTILLPSLTDISDGLNSTPTVTNLSIALYLLSLSIFPLWWSFFSETYGRRSVYIVSFTFFVIFNVLTAVSNNIALFLVMRVLAGGSSGSVQAVGAGTIADIWEVKERGRAMGYFYLGPLMGPLLGEDHVIVPNRMHQANCRLSTCHWGCASKQVGLEEFGLVHGDLWCRHTSFAHLLSARNTQITETDTS